MDPSPRDRARQALRAHAPELAGAPLTELGSGLDNAAFLAGDLVVRVAPGDGAPREARLLGLVGPRVPLAVPAPRFAAAGVLAYPRLPGRPLLGRRPPAGAAAALGRFLRALHGIDPALTAGAAPADDAEPGDWLEGLEGPPDALALMRATVPPPARRRVLAHADLGAEHLLAAGGRITGVIDWSDTAVTDPALDLARPLRDFGERFLAGVLAAYGPLGDLEATMARVWFFARCAALEDLAYGRAPGREAYARAAERSLPRFFSPRGS